MKVIFAMVTIAVLLCACNNNTEKSTTGKATEIKSVSTDTGWISLFDGKTTTGWHTYGKTTIGEAWKVADGNLYLDTTVKDGWQIKGGGDIVSAEEYENFHFKTDWKISPYGNSGIIFYINEDTSKYKYCWNTGPEMQVLDNAGHTDASIMKHRAGDLYDLISCSKQSVKPVGEWNLAEIVSNKGKLDFYLNGINVVSTTLWDSSWSALLAASKFKDMPGFGTFKKGRIALQDHGNTVFYRNIMIKRL
jgi:hypothetical protein